YWTACCSSPTARAATLPCHTDGAQLRRASPPYTEEGRSPRAAEESRMPGFFYQIGRLVGSNLRKANWVARSLAGTEAEAARAEHAVGRDLAASFLESAPLDDHP